MLILALGTQEHSGMISVFIMMFGVFNQQSIRIVRAIAELTLVFFVRLTLVYHGCVDSEVVEFHEEFTADGALWG